jgi:hypothetical protein
MRRQKTKPNPKTLKSMRDTPPVNGLKMYTEIHGDWKTAGALHGSYMTIDLNFAHTHTSSIKSAR